VVDLESLLAATSEQPPCGPDLEYDVAFRDLENSARGKPEQQFGATVIAGEGPAWSEVRDAAIALLGRSKDLRVATLLTQALVHTDELAGLLTGLQLIHQLLERYWDDVHPRLDVEDDNDPTMRVSALAPLVHAEALILDLRGASLVRSRQHGQIMVRDVEIALGRLPTRKGVEAMSQRQIDTILAAIAAEDPQSLAVAGQALAAARMLSEFLVDRVGVERAPDFKPLLAILSMLGQVCRSVVGDAPAADEAGEAPSDESAAAVKQEKPMTGEIRTREDALLMLDRVIAYFERNEPTNPAPLLMKRARRIGSMSFFDIIKDMAPESLKQIETIAGQGKEG
jgi:type VI secretion system protein ImpA